MNIVEVKIPYLPGLSKNKKATFGKGRYYTNPEYKNAVEALILFIKTNLKGVQFKEDKLWLEIFYQKPRMNADVANLIDSISDATKEAIGVDDKWFSLKADWEYDKKTEPYIVITLRQ
jgi:Holliday junction resolvase RusA-like endonuclease